MSDVLRIYVAGSSDERERAKKWMQRLRDFPGVFEVVSAWCDVIDGEQHGVGNPRTASTEDRKRWAMQNVDQITEADVFWFLVPAVGHGRGGYFESGFAFGQMKLLFSGDTKQSVFCALGYEFTTDEEAFDFILKEMGIR